jgi:hypothetical protein
MPLSINVGLSRKASRDYQSAGVSINVSAELDQALLAKPDELQKQVGDLYAQAQQALDRQANMLGEPSQPDSARNRGNGHPQRSNGNGHRDRNNGGNGRGDRMTDSQHRAITSIARRLNCDLDFECREIVGAAFDDLTIRQASDMIDYLKSQQPANNTSRR